MKHITVGAALLAATFSVQAQRSEVEFTEFDLDNGLHVILHEDHSTPIVAVTVLYHVGSKDEVVGRTGFAHFFEHLLFEGSENIGRGEYSKIVQSNGGALNANTTQDRTFYYEILPSNQLELGLWLESERMLHANIDNEGVETQRGVVKEEKRLRIDNQPYGSWISEMFSRAFTNHPYHWAPIGSMDDLNAAQLEEFMDFYRKFYNPNNATLSIAGDIDPDEAREMIELYFGDIPAGEPVVHPTVEEGPLNGPIIDTVYDNIQVPGVFVGYRIPSQTSEDAYALEMLNNVLSQGGSSLLPRKMVDEQQIALQVFSFPYTLEDYGVFITLALANGETTTGELVASMDEEVEKLKTSLIEEETYQRALNQVESSFIQSNSSMAGIAESLANYHVYFGDANLINAEIERYRKVTREDIQRVAKEYLSDDNRVILHYLPMAQQASN
ncbi:M16 family metallopeptidase [Phaeocystidibacter luteus]|uniref:Insulinase family protein n=1 Tax=Phaeocystidibacter luteus TaxID=911197 RepID=A0A6N6RGQ0_9FLAO|nr:pitrilysin family protein [Phaeocystidibacter luteus]KAB2810346.1 insulinase family protein [Phaeocystidibacter luteus]